MIKKTEKLLTLLLILPVFTACTSIYEEAGAPPSYYGNAVEQNAAAQIVNPEAPQTDEPPIHVGSRIDAAQRRYLADKVEEPKSMTTSDVGSSSE